jgi:hypothetical protein
MALRWLNTAIQALTTYRDAAQEEWPLVPGEVEAVVLEMRRAHRYWGAHRLVVKLAKKQVEPLPSESAVYRGLVCAPGS